MFSPTVTELPRRLEPIARDTFSDTGRIAAVATDAAPRLDNVVVLRPASGGARPAGLAAA